MEKTQLNSDISKLISTFLIVVVFMVIFITAINSIINRTFNSGKQNYYENANELLYSYSRLVRLQLENYRSSIGVFPIEDFLSSASDEKIHEFLKKNSYKANPDFFEIYYFDKKENRGFFSNGNIIELNSKNYPKIEKNDFYVSDIDNIPDSYENGFIIEIPVFDKSNSQKGSICASIKLSDFTEHIKNIKIGKKGSIIILDGDGRFITSNNDKLIGNKYFPSDKRYNDFSSEYIANAHAGKIESVSTKGEIIDLLFSKIKGTQWTIGVVLPKADIQRMYEKNYNTKKIIFTLTFSFIFILLLIEIKKLSYFEKKQFFIKFHDPLTHLWTRQHFEKKAAKILKADRDSKFMLVECDIRGFKFINQNYGEKGADKLLVFFANMLNEFAQESCGIIGHGYADHFYGFFKVDLIQKTMSVFKANLEKVTKEAKSYDIPFFAKFGISFYMPENAKDKITIKELIGQASFAKSTIKDNLLTQYSVYNSRLLKKINEERFIESQMLQALEKEQFFVMYQPKISLIDEKVVGAEALVRWKSPELGLLLPSKFIPLFEQNGFIVRLDFFVYECVFKFLSKQIKNGKKIIPISINMSRNHNKPEKFMHDFLELFRKYDVPADYIQLEVIERSFMDNNTLREITTLLHKEGFSVAMDDFGSGESSLNMLTKIPVDVLKFDKDFLESSTNEDGALDDKAAGFIKILVDLSKNLEKKTVFEGVETQQQRDFLKSIECDQAQGFFYSRPLSEEDFLKFIGEHS